MGVGGADQAELVGVHANPGFDLEAVLDGLANITAIEFRDRRGRADVPLHDLEAGELVVRREQRMRFGRAFHLCDFGEWFVAGAEFGPGAVDRGAVPHRALVHRAVGAVGIVRDGERLEPPTALLVHPSPEVFGVLGIERGVGELGCVVAGEDHVAVEVAAFRHRGELVAD